MTTDNTLAVECTALHKTYTVGFRRRRVLALNGVDLSVQPGEVFGLIGPNGAGKSTTIKILLNLVQPSSGAAKLFGIDVRDPRSRATTGFVPEAPVPYEHLTGREYLHFQATLAGLPAAERLAEVKRVLARVEMERNADLQIRRYSKGMTQRIMLAGAILGRPRLVVLDEPTSGLDPLGRRLVRDLILELRRDGAAVLFCTHIISDVESLCDRVALLLGGQVRKAGRIADLVGAGVKTHELVVAPASVEAVTGLLGELARNVQAVNERVLFSVSDDQLQGVLQRLVQAGLPVTRLQPERFTLENTFLEELQQSHAQVGGVFE